jgi:hypothetical protein
VTVHPICHRMIHRCFSNAELARLSANGDALREHPQMQRFLAWIANKPADFHVATRKGGS